MPPLVIPATVQAQIIWGKNGADHAVNVLHFINNTAAPVTQAMVDDVAAGMVVAFNEPDLTPVAFRTRISNDYTLERVTLRDINVANQPLFESTGSPLSTGSSSADPLPDATALVVTLRTELAGRKFRGRIYTCGWAETQSGGDGQPAAAQSGHAVLFVNAIQREFLIRQGLQLAVASRVDLASRQVTSTDADNRWDTQRRRGVPGI